MSTRLVATPASSVLVPLHLSCGPQAGIDLVVFESVVSLAARVGLRSLDGILIELRADAGTTTVGVIRELRKRFSQCPIIAVVRAVTRDRDLVPAGIAAGATDLALIGYEDLSSCVRRACDGSSFAAAPEDEILYALEPNFEPDVWPFMAYAVRTAAQRLSVDQFAAGFGLSRSALSRRLRKHGFSSAAALLNFARALVAATLLQQRTACVTSVAETLRFRTPYAFRLFLRKQLGARPGQIRRGPHIGHALRRLVPADCVGGRVAPRDILAEIRRGFPEEDPNQHHMGQEIRSA
jgi:AraC-like DNA-binding protein